MPQTAGVILKLCFFGSNCDSWGQQRELQHSTHARLPSFCTTAKLLHELSITPCLPHACPMPHCVQNNSVCSVHCELSSYVLGTRCSVLQLYRYSTSALQFHRYSISVLKLNNYDHSFVYTCTGETVMLYNCTGPTVVLCSCTVT